MVSDGSYVTTPTPLEKKKWVVTKVALILKYPIFIILLHGFKLATQQDLIEKKRDNCLLFLRA
jgi:hypothetical protein